jgi:aminopeptidase N
MIRVSHFVAAGLLCFAAVAGAAETPEHALREVLPDTVVPTHYDLALFPDAKALTFSGKVAITLDVHAATNDVVLNAVGLAFEHATVDGGPDAVVTLENKTGRAALRFPNPIPKGQHVLTIAYTGKIGHSTLGFFAMDYASPNGPRRTLATNFEPAYARDLLPCWDEPGRKATFTVSIDAPKDQMAVSNMPVAAVTPLPGKLQRVRFAETPKMSTYLLFVGVGDFERIHKSVDGVDVGVVVKRGDTPKAAYALDQAVTLLHYYNDYFGVRYPLPKLDLIAAPGEIEGGSMENWGAIFYSQHHVLFDSTRSTETDRRLVFLVVSHEMAHQWFGDLVTMAWWDNLWLNEGFARWMQTFAADDLHPEWETGLRAASIFELGKEADAGASTHPVVQEVLTADQAEQAFDTITYDKGAALITMMNAYMGRDHFRAGVRRYMQAHSFGNTVDSDLWTLMEQEAGKPILAIEHDFTRQTGVPLVRVTGTATGVELKEGRFAQDPASISAEAPRTWNLPLAVGSAGHREGGQTLLLKGTTDVSVAAPALVNVGQFAYARVLYDGGAFDALAPDLAALEPMDQLGLLNDTFALGTSGYAPANRIVKLPTVLPAAANPIVWARVIALLELLDTHYGETPARVAFRAFALNLVSPVAARVGPSAAAGESSNITLLRESLLVSMSTFGDAAVIERARQRFANSQGSAPELRTSLSIVATHADAATFDALLDKAHKTSDPLEKQHLFTALSNVAEPALARRMTQIALSDQVPAGTAASLIGTLAVRHPDLVWPIVAPRLDDASLDLTKGQRWELAQSIAGHSADPRRVNDLDAYVARSVPADARRPFLQTVALIRHNQRVAEQVLPEIDTWIRAHAKSQ